MFDIQFKPRQESIFATVGADGSLRLFDLRNLQHSAIVFESKVRVERGVRVPRLLAHVGSRKAQAILR